MESYQAPLFWFGPQMLRRWLWTVRRGYLSEDTEDNLYLLAEGVQDKSVFHSVIQQVILNVDYARILDCLNQSEFRRFVDDQVSFWTNPVHHPEWLGRSVRVRDRYNRVRRILVEAYEQSNLRPRLSIRGLIVEIERAISLVHGSLPLAELREGLRAPEAQQEVRNGCGTALERVEKLLDLLLQFALSLADVCGVSADISSSTSWGPKELALHNTCAEILHSSLHSGLVEEVAHLTAEIQRFAGFCYGTEIKNKKKEVRLPNGDPQPSGQLMLLLSRFRELRNDVSHATSTIRTEAGLPKSLIDAAKSIIPYANEFVKIVRDETCFPEIVRIVSLEKGINGVELSIIAVPNEREYRAVYPDESLMSSLAREADCSLACTEGDQDFWLFPTPSSYRERLLNPLLLPLGNRENYNTQTVALEIAGEERLYQPESITMDFSQTVVEQEIE